MKLKWKLGISVPIVLIAIGIVCWFTLDSFQERIDEWVYFATIETRLTIHPPPPRCKVRESTFNSRVEQIRRDARDSLKVGTTKEEVIAFFAKESIPVSFFQLDKGSEAEGTTYIKGDPACFSLACGDDTALIGVRVALGNNGTVVSDPVIVGMYADCL